MSSSSIVWNVVAVGLVAVAGHVEYSLVCFSSQMFLNLNQSFITNTIQMTYVVVVVGTAEISFVTYNAAAPNRNVIWLM